MSKISIKTLQKCSDEEAVNQFFLDNRIDSLKDKILYLKKAMGEKESYYSGGNDLSEENIYKDDVYLFLRGTWRSFT